jgi:hypothetical protein
MEKLFGLTVLLKLTHAERREVVKQEARSRRSLPLSWGSGLRIGCFEDGITEEGFNFRCLLGIPDRLGHSYPPSVSRRTNKVRQP